MQKQKEEADKLERVQRCAEDIGKSQQQPS